MNSRIGLRAILCAVAALALTGVGAGTALAQQTGTIQGTVTEAATARPLASAQVTIQGTQLGTLTNTQGRFQLVNVPAGTHTLQVQLVGFTTTTREVTVTAGEVTTVTVEIGQTAIELQEVVVTGVAGATTRAKVPFDIATVQADDMPVPTVSAGTAIQGKVAGAQVVSGSGRPGAAPSILLRGATSIDASGRSQEPLYIVDGVILSGSMVDVDALDIESIEVVKGAAAASLYGSRAASGVIQIQTRRGARMGDDQVRYTFRSELGQSQIPNTPDALLSERHPFRMEGDRFVSTAGDACAFLDCPSLAQAGQLRGEGSANQWNTYQSERWPGQTYDQVSRFFEEGSFLQNYIAAEGRAGRTNFHVSYSNLQDDGILRGLQGLSRNNFRVNLDQSVRDNLQVSASTFYSRSTSDVFPESQGNPMFLLTRVPAGVNIFGCEGNPNQNCLNDPRNLILQPDPQNTQDENPIYNLLNRDYVQERGRFLGSATLRYSPVSWFDIDANASYDRLDAEEQDLFPQGFRTISPDASVNNGYLDRYVERDEALNASITGTFRFNLAPNISNRTQVRYLYEQQDEQWTFTSGYNFPVADVPVFDNVDPTTLGAQSSLQKIRADGYFAITNFDIFDRYIIDALVRNDGSSLFGSEERRQWYYRLAGAWRMSEESWFQLPAVDELKLRYAYGTAGGRPRFEAQYETFSVSGGVVTPITLGNNQLKPEFSREQEAGIDASFMGGRFGLGLTYANTVTEDQILRVPLPSYTGYTRQWQNAGTLESNTWEASLNARLVQTEDLTWSARLLFDRTRSEITELNVPPYQYGVAGQNLGTVFQAREGEALGTFYGVRAATSCDELPSGMNCSEFTTNSDGLLVWVGEGGSLSNPQWGQDAGFSVNGAAISWGAPMAGQCTDRTTGERTYFCPVGNSLPDYSVSFSSTLDWRGFSVYGLLDAQQGFDVYNQPLQWAVFAGLAGIYDQDDADPVSAKPIGYYAAQYSNLGGLQPSSLFTEDASFVKLRELAVRYRFGQDQLGGLPGLNRFSGIGISLIGRNLLTWTDYRGFDPEVGKAGGDTGSAALARVEGYQYPNFRTFTLGLELNF